MHRLAPNQNGDLATSPNVLILILAGGVLSPMAQIRSHLPRSRGDPGPGGWACRHGLRISDEASSISSHRQSGQRGDYMDQCRAACKYSVHRFIERGSQPFGLVDWPDADATHRAGHQ